MPIEPMLLYSLLSALGTTATNIGLSERQKEHEVDMMNQQNQYNLPENQIKRLQDAGINPASFGMGQGMKVEGNTSASPNPYMAPSIGDPMMMATNSLLQMMNATKSGEEAKTERDSREVRIENIKAQTEQYNQQCIMLGLDQRAQQIANEWSDILNEIAAEEGKSRIHMNEATVEKLTADTETARYRLTEVLPKEVQKLIEENKLNVLEQDKVVAEIQRIFSEENLFNEQSGYYDQLTKSEWYKQAGYTADTEQKQVQTDYLRHQVQMYLDTYDEQASIVANQAKLSNREVKAFWIKTSVGALKDIAVGAGSAAGGAFAAIKGLGALK